MTERFAQRCDRLLAVDVVDTALEQAQARCRALSHVTFEKIRVPQSFPEGSFDVILLSEVGYYWAPEDLERSSRTAEERGVSPRKSKSPGKLLRGGDDSAAPRTAPLLPPFGKGVCP